MVRLTLSCTLPNVIKSCFRVRKMRFAVPSAVFRLVILSVLECKIVKVRMQDWLVGDARQTIWGSDIDCFGGIFARFLTNETYRHEITFRISRWLSITYLKSGKIRKNRRKTVVSEARRILRRFFRVKKVSCVPFPGLGVILFYHDCLEKVIRVYSLMCFLWNFQNIFS